MRLQNKIALITGGSRGMGASHVKLFINEGAKVYFTDVLEEDGHRLSEELGEQAVFLKHNVADEEDWKNVTDTIRQAEGKLDILVNNAGIGDKTFITESTPETTSLEDWNRVIGVNLTGTFLGMKYILPLMKENGGSIINISSVAAMIGTSGPFAYTASKGGVRSMTKNVAAHYAKYNIRVNSIHPGGVKTPMISSDEDMLKQVSLAIPLGRISEPAELSNVVLFFATEESSYITGAELVVDGGLSIV